MRSHAIVGLPGTDHVDALKTVPPAREAPSNTCSVVDAG